MKLILSVGIGSFLGGIGRYLLSLLIYSKSTSSFPFATLSVNIIGCFLIGVVFAIGEKTHLRPEWQLFLITGILGGFTTFSAFSIEAFNLLRSGMTAYAITYISASVVVGILSTWTGYFLLKLS